jgi:nitrogen fixation-related uncharacterized protein
MVISEGARTMEAMILLVVMIVGLAVLGAASIAWGVDSREPYPDDHTR